MRGPLVAPDSPALRDQRRWGHRMPATMSRAEAFVVAVRDAVARVQQTCPDALAGVEIGVEDVPRASSTTGRVPLAVAVERTAHQPARVVIYRRPLEHRAASRRGLRILVHRTLVEQLSALTGRSVSDIDPQVDLDED